MVKIKLAIALIMLLALKTNAQLSTFNLQDYKVPDYKYRVLQGGISLSGSSDQEFLNTYPYIVRENKFNATATLRLNFEQNSRKRQSGYSVLLDARPQFSRRYGDNQIIARQRKFNGNISLSAYTRKYYKTKRFFEINGTNQTHFNLNQSGVNIENKNIYFDDQTKVNLLHGHGRVENVTQAWKAYRMIEDIQNRGLGGENLTSEDISQLADLLTERLNTRWFDRRHKRIEDIEMIAAFLKEKGIDDNAAALTSIYDSFDYGINNSRYSGSRFSYGLTLGNDYSLYKNNGMDYKHINGGILGGKINYTYHKPINEKWQFNGGAGLEFGNLIYGESNSETNYANIDMNIGIGYYPNSRTSFTSEFKTRIHSTVPYGPNGNFQDHVSYRFDNNFDYYITPQLRLNANVSLSKLNEYFQPSGFKLNYSLGIKYTFF